MHQIKEVTALFKLLDDPDAEVFSIISNRIMDYGNNIIPHLENEWENTGEKVFMVKYILKILLLE